MSNYMEGTYTDIWNGIGVIKLVLPFHGLTQTLANLTT